MLELFISKRPYRQGKFSLKRLILMILSKYVVLNISNKKYFCVIFKILFMQVDIGHGEPVPVLTSMHESNNKYDMEIAITST